MDSLKKLSTALPFILELAALKKEVDSHRPFPKDLDNKVFQKLRLDWNYNSNAIEGNSFTRGETVTLIMEGVTAKGKPLKDALDIKGHNQAIDFIMRLIKEERQLVEADIRALHKLVLGEDFFSAAETSEGKATRKIIRVGQYKTQPNHVKTPTGEIHYYATPEETPAKMEELMQWYQDATSEKDTNPVVLASLFHHKFVEIHPFDDGNGRMTRLLTNFILLKYGYPVSVIKQENRSAYYAALAQADNGEVIPIIEFISESIKSSFEIMLKAIHGEDISEDDDLDKEIELFRKESGLTRHSKVSRHDTNLTYLLFEILSYPSNKLLKLSDLFESKEIMLRYNDSVMASNSFVRFRKNEISTLETFKTLLAIKLFDLTSELSFSFSLSNHISNSKIGYITNSIEIRFNEDNYSINFNGQKIVKLYDDKVYDKAYLNLMKRFVQSYIDEIKKSLD